MIKEDFNSKVHAFLETQDHKGNDEWYCTPREIANEVMGRFADFLFPTPVPVMVDSAALEAAIAALTEATKKLSPADGNRASNEQAISVLTKALKGN